jgi:hypothetical protein
LAGGIKKLHQYHPGTVAVSWCSCRDFNVWNTQPITNIFCNCVSYIPYNSFMRFNDTKSQLIFSFARPLASAWFVKLQKSTEMTCDSKVQQFWHYKKHLRLTCWQVWGYKCVHHACKMCHHNAQGYAVGVPHPSWKTLRDVLNFIWKELKKVNKSKWMFIIKYILESTYYMGIAVVISFQSNNKWSQEGVR